MIILDTNVISEPLRPHPDAVVLQWLDAQQPETLYLTSVNVAELLSGVERLPRGRRRTSLERAIADQFLPLFADRLLAFDQPAALAFAKIDAKARAGGRPVSFADAAIAAIAHAHGFMLATRNVRDFEGIGVPLVNPWDFAT